MSGTTETYGGLINVPFEDLKKKMGINSNKMIDSIINFAEKAGLDMTTITSDIKENMAYFLHSKQGITVEYKEGTPSDTPHYENRERFRKNTRKLIPGLLQQATEKIGENIDEDLIPLREELKMWLECGICKIEIAKVQEAIRNLPQLEMSRLFLRCRHDMIYHGIDKYDVRHIELQKRGLIDAKGAIPPIVQWIVKKTIKGDDSLSPDVLSIEDYPAEKLLEELKTTPLNELK